MEIRSKSNPKESPSRTERVKSDFLIVVGFAVLSVPAGGFGTITAADQFTF